MCEREREKLTFLKPQEKAKDAYMKDEKKCRNIVTKCDVKKEGKKQNKVNKFTYLSAMTRSDGRTLRRFT